MTNPYAIHTVGLSRQFGEIWAVRDVDLHVPQRSIYAFLGPNGAGKTTLIRMLLGLLTPTAGEVHLFGQRLSRTDRTQLGRIGALVENPSLYPQLTGRENLEVTQRLLGLAKTRPNEVLEVVGLSTAADQRVSTYSMGMKQRLGLALALLGEPSLLILDEPTNGLDPAGIREMRSLLRALPERLGVTVFLSSHLLSEVQLIATHVGIIQNGALRWEGTLEALEAQQHKALTLRVGDIPAARRLLEEAGYTVTLPDAETLVVGESERAALPDVHPLLAARDIPVIELRYGAQTLEDVFLHMTTQPANQQTPEAMEDYA